MSQGACRCASSRRQSHCQISMALARASHNFRDLASNVLEPHPGQRNCVHSDDPERQRENDEDRERKARRGRLVDSEHGEPEDGEELVGAHIGWGVGQGRAEVHDEKHGRADP
jgi:hypothetical protein